MKKKKKKKKKKSGRYDVYKILRNEVSTQIQNSKQASYKSKIEEFGKNLKNSVHQTRKKLTLTAVNL